MTAQLRSPLLWVGGKFYSAQHILAAFPPPESYGTYEVGSLPTRRVLPHGGSAFGATAHDDVHGAFMTLPRYTRIREGEVHELILGVRKCSCGVLADPLSEPSEGIERACEATSAEGTARCASRGKR